MCGIIACLLANKYEHCNQFLLDGLTVLQHRGQGTHDPAATLRCQPQTMMDLLLFSLCVF